MSPRTAIVGASNAKKSTGMRYAVRGVVAFFLACPLWLFVGCTPMPVPGSQVPPQTWRGASPATPLLTQQTAYDTLVAMNAERVTSDLGQRHVSGILSGAVLMHITLTPQGTGTLVVVHGSVLPDKFGIGTFDEVERYVSLFQQKVAATAARAGR